VKESLIYERAEVLMFKAGHGRVNYFGLCWGACNFKECTEWTLFYHG
jgi:hypothetical protein